jgi:hypothetical protein
MHPSLLTHLRLSIVPDRDSRAKKKVLVGNLESSSSAKEIIARTDTVHITTDTVHITLGLW